MSVNQEYCNPLDGYKTDFWMKLEHCGRYLFAKKKLEDAGCSSVADMACAVGYGSKLLSGGLSVYAFDRSAEYISIAREKYCAPHVKFGIADFDEDDLTQLLPTVDAIVCFETLEHVKKPDLLLKQFNNILTDDGILLLSVPNWRYERFDEFGKNKDPYHLNVFSDEDIDRMLRNAGFITQHVFGQDICNRIVSRVSERKLQGIDDDRLMSLFDYDESSICQYSEIFAWPETDHETESYSIIRICQKNIV